MSRILRIVVAIALACLALSILGGLIWANTVYARQNPGEKAFLIPWLAGRTFLSYGESPYGEPASQRAQVIYYGRLAEAGEDPLRLYLPFYIELGYLPFSLIPDYALARGLFTLVIEIALIGLAILSLRLTGWRPGRLLLPFFFLLFLLWPPVLRLLLDAKPVIFAALAAAGVLATLRAEQDEVAGGLLVLVACQPDIAAVFLLFIVWWIAYSHRWRVIWGFLMVVVVLSAFAFFLLPDWFMPFLRGLYSLVRHNPGLSPGRIMADWWPAIGTRLGWLLTAGLAVVLFLEWRFARDKSWRHFLWTVCLTLAVSPLIGIPISLDYYAFLMLPLTLLLALFNERWGRPRGWGVGGYVMILLLALFWSWFSLLDAFDAFAALPATLFLIFPFFLLVGLYWVRWWAIRPPRTWLEMAEAEIGKS
ncbi:MAG: DUF2029 domain-containing protein [Anaerolineales bacterium]|nr:DUF2029 domain-containing protein [Anaerolineales bacterium]